LDDTPEAMAKAEQDVMNNVQTAAVFAYHVLLKKPQLLVSESFLPRDKIKAAVSQHRLRESQRAAAGKTITPREADDLSSSDDEQPANNNNSNNDNNNKNNVGNAELDDLNDLLGAMEAKQTDASTTGGKSEAEALADDLDALMSAPKQAAPAPPPDVHKKTGGTKSAVSRTQAAASAPTTRRRSRTVSAGSGTPKPSKYADMLREKLTGVTPAKSKTPADAVDDVIAFATAATTASNNNTASSSSNNNNNAPVAPISAVARSSAVQTRKRAASMGQKFNAQKPNNTAAAAPSAKSPPKEKTGTWSANIFKRNKKKTATTSAPSSPQTAGQTWDPSTYAKAKHSAASAAAQNEMRTVKGVFKCATTSTRPPDEFVAAIEQALISTGEVKWKRKSQWLFRCADKKSKVRFEVEVVMVEKLEGVYGIRFARISGDSFQYKNLVTHLMEQIADGN